MVYTTNSLLFFFWVSRVGEHAEIILNETQSAAAENKLAAALKFLQDILVYIIVLVN